jgi:gliding motility-associated-like protein
MIKPIVNFLYVLLLLLVCSIQARATHIVGADFYYEYLGDNRYRVTMDVYQDCISGTVSAIEFDNPAYFSIYRLDDDIPYIIDTTVYASRAVSVPNNFSNECVNNPPNTCLRKTTFSKVYTLPPTQFGYRILYQRCCRNGDVLNIRNPLSTGATYYAQIPGQPAYVNNSAKFVEVPPQIICVNEPLVYNHAAIDPDGDSISYELCTGYEGGSLFGSDVKPIPKNELKPLQYLNPYSGTVPIIGSPSINIDPVTGLLTARPTNQGRYIVTVCAHEWRNGVIINTVRREFQFVVTNCSRKVVANIPQLSDEPNTYLVWCKNFTVDFLNESSPGQSYHWNFGDPRQPNATSNEYQPQFTYSDTGTYIVTLYVNKGSTCSDSIYRYVKVYPYFESNFDYNGLYCPDQPILFTDKSVTHYGQVANRQWHFGDDKQSIEAQPSHKYLHGGTFDVTLISGNNFGCLDTFTKTIDINHVVIKAPSDTTVALGQQVQLYGYGGYTYQWTPIDGLTNPNSQYPTFSSNRPGVFGYQLQITTENGCVATDSVYVEVVANPYLIIPNAFSPNSDGLNDIFRIQQVGIGALQTFKIFNRFGEMVFYTKDIRNGWDGTYKGTQAPLGVYFYFCEFKKPDGSIELYKGDVTIVR